MKMSTTRPRRSCVSVSERLIDFLWQRGQCPNLGSVAVASRDDNPEPFCRAARPEPSHRLDTALVPDLNLGSRPRTGSAVSAHLRDETGGICKKDDGGVGLSFLQTCASLPMPNG